MSAKITGWSKPCSKKLAGSIKDSKGSLSAQNILFTSVLAQFNSLVGRRLFPGIFPAGVMAGLRVPLRAPCKGIVAETGRYCPSFRVARRTG